VERSCGQCEDEEEFHGRTTLAKLHCAGDAKGASLSG
jgi:hypothetical protein